MSMREELSQPGQSPENIPPTPEQKELLRQLSEQLTKNARYDDVFFGDKALMEVFVVPEQKTVVRVTRHIHRTKEDLIQWFLLCSRGGKKPFTRSQAERETIDAWYEGKPITGDGPVDLEIEINKTATTNLYRLFKSGKIEHSMSTEPAEDDQAAIDEMQTDSASVIAFLSGKGPMTEAMEKFVNMQKRREEAAEVEEELGLNMVTGPELKEVNQLLAEIAGNKESSLLPIKDFLEMIIQETPEHHFTEGMTGDERFEFARRVLTKLVRVVRGDVTNEMTPPSKKRAVINTSPKSLDVPLTHQVRNAIETLIRAGVTGEQAKALIDDSGTLAKQVGWERRRKQLEFLARAVGNRYRKDPALNLSYASLMDGRPRTGHDMAVSSVLFTNGVPGLLVELCQVSYKDLCEKYRLPVVAVESVLRSLENAGLTLGMSEAEITQALTP